MEKPGARERQEGMGDMGYKRKQQDNCVMASSVDLTVSMQSCSLLILIVVFFLKLAINTSKTQWD